MEKITSKTANRLAESYLKNPDHKYLVYNIRRRRYLLHDTYTYFYRFSRREAVWNTTILNIEEATNDSYSLEKVSQTIYSQTNQLVDDLLDLKLKREFTQENCLQMLAYYFNAKCYLAYYDYYLGRVVLIKERDKSIDFIELVGQRYHFIGNLHDIIQDEIGLDRQVIESIMTSLMDDILIQEIPGIDQLTAALHPYLCQEISKIEDYMSQIREAQ